jgi:predicted hydrocarbon binding protein
MVMRMNHLHKWIKSLMENLDEHVDEKTKITVLENWGRACITRSFLKKVQKCKKNAENTSEFVDRLQQIWSNLHRDGDDISVVYKTCYCPLVRGCSQQLPATFCNCSRGWIKELFESALEKHVDVILEKSILRGDDCCKLRVYL